MRSHSLSSLPDLLQALDDLADRRANGDLTPIRLELADGDYALTETLLLEAGKHDHLALTAAPGATPTLHSLVRLSDWTIEEKNDRTVWTTKVPDLHPRMLFVNGSPVRRARFPKEGFLSAVPYENDKVPPLHMGTNRVLTHPGDIDPDWTGFGDAELVGCHFWTEERLPDLRFAPASCVLTSSHRTMYRLTEGTKPLPFRYYLENLSDALSEPGTWCFRSSEQRLQYLPKPGETPENTRLEIPTLNQLVGIRGYGYGERKSGGTPGSAETLRGLKLEGLTFTGCDWVPHQGRNLGVDHTVPSDGLPIGASVQGAFDACAALQVRYVDAVDMVDCCFTQLGGHAVRIGMGCAKVQVHHCEFQELGGGAVIVHGADLDGPASGRTRDIKIADNICEKMGRVFPSACGILGGAVERMQVLHNHIRDLYYSGISLGWTWGYADTVSRGHLVEGNRVEDVSQGMLNDLGGIYLVGANTGSIIRRNWVRNVQSANFGAQGIYLDEGCRNILIEQNRVENCGEACINMHYGEGHLIRDNLLIGGHAGIRLSRDDGKATWTAIRNLILDCDSPYSAGYALGNLAGSSCQADLNLIHPGTPDTLTLRHPTYLLDPPLSFSDWQAAGNDLHSLFQAPGPDPASSEFMGVPGFRVFDVSICGPRIGSTALPESRPPEDTHEFNG